MRFLFKRKPISYLQEELLEVRQTMCSNGLVVLDLLFYSFIFTLLIMPLASTLAEFTGTFIVIYISCLSLFLFIGWTVRGDLE